MYINVDNGGTFTDFWAFDAERKFAVKTRTTPHDLSECLFEGLRRLSEEIYRKSDIGKLLSETKYIRYSTTQGTNALVQRKGPRIGLIVATDSVPSEMRGNDPQTAELLDALVGRRIEVMDTQALADVGADDSVVGDLVMNAVNRLTAAGANRIVVGLGSAEAERALQRLAARRFPQHLLGTVPILKVSDVTADANPARATWTAVLNAFLHPAMERFLYNTDNRLKAMNLSAPLLVFRNDGLAGRVAKTSAINTYGSGPEGGMCGAEALAKAYEYGHLVTIDVGGTTTDFGVIDNGNAIKRQFGRVETVDVSIPMSDLRSIGVGGGSVIRAEGGTIRVGPESVGAAPGPACFGFGGTEATITDVKLLTGVIDPEHYFGGQMQLDARRAENAVLAKIAKPLGIETEAAIHAMENAWVEAIAIHLRRCLKPDTVLGAFGGAGPFAICAIAEAVGVKKAIIPSQAAVFSASGIGESGIGHRYDDLLTGPEDDESAARRVEALLARARQDMFAEGFDLESCDLIWTLSTTGGDTRRLSTGDVAPALARLEAGIAVLELAVSHLVGRNQVNGVRPTANAAAVAMGKRKVRFARGAETTVPLYHTDRLAPGMSGNGPAIIESSYFTLPVLDGWTFHVTGAGDIELNAK